MYEKIKHIFESNGCEINESQYLLFEKYAALLLEENKKVNLISRKDEGKIWENHILHSLSLVLDSRFLGNDNLNNMKILDIGTGGGVPGIPIKIMFPDCSITLLDSIQKKITCVQRIVAELKLKDIHCVCGRAEEIGKKKEYANKYDVVVSRAVAPLVDLVNWGKLLLKNGGKLFALKGGNLEEELKKCKTGFNLAPEVFDIDLEGLEYLKEAEKKIVVVENLQVF
jgi:16S rRNA (guanine527-N7)-methyltransferase